ncbi:uncharacterized protein EV420DRAFT_1258036 [Desarmillaria tabescens]|uniref:MARVEL domain-containing protein n=1 Tax=Armillaria tabescens TaxID=1929756 RepID=A0AA39NQJ3_ARMTA|nr:uncharacterized protein EV420DRAFT_1258036 [Desarmillaria tabescens]KAK0469956.1 hypothetical protein EV420DRAFT_1258036 [Desarmillaria tabescens]
MIISKPAIVFHASQIFFNFLAMACFASVASFQAKYGVGPSGLSSFTLFLTVLGMLVASVMLAVPVIYEKYDKLATLARAMKVLRVGFILTGAETSLSLLIAFVVTISAWTQAGCKNADNDPNADKSEDFKNGLPGWCNTKKAGAIFLWLAFVFWTASLGLLIWEWRKSGGRPLRGRKPQDEPFAPPMDHESVTQYDEDEDDSTSLPHHAQPTGGVTAQDPFSDTNRYSGASAQRPTSTAYSGRPSMDQYGAFSDPAPSGYSAGSFVPVLPEPDLGPQVSRTMQYADPYAKVKATLGQGQQPAAQYGGSTPPNYDGYGGGYR